MCEKKQTHYWEVGASILWEILHNICISTLLATAVYRAYKNLFISEAAHYVVGETAFKDCEEQGMLNIRNKEECKAACDELGIPIDKLRDNRICIRAGNQKCRQQNTAGAKTSRICKQEGSLQIYIIRSQKQNFISVIL